MKPGSSAEIPDHERFVQRGGHGSSVVRTHCDAIDSIRVAGESAQQSPTRSMKRGPERPKPRVASGASHRIDELSYRRFPDMLQKAAHQLGRELL